MFEDEYRSEMDDKRPNDQSLHRLEIEMTKAVSIKKKRVIYTSRIFKSVAAIAVCIAVILVCNSPLINNLYRGDVTTGAEDTTEKASSYENIYAAIKNLSTEDYDMENSLSEDGGSYSSGGKGSNSTGGQGSTTGKGTTSDYSGTNLQVAGVEEADIIKTDGEYIYAISSKYIYIVSANDGQMEIVSKLPVLKENEGTTSNAFEIYITGSRLVVLYNSCKNVRYDTPSTSVTPDVSAFSEKEQYYDSYYPSYSQRDIRADLYDISDRSNPTLINTIGQSGYYNSSRMVGDILYLVTTYSIYGTPDLETPSSFVPSLYVNGVSSAVAANDVFIYDNISSANYTVVTGIDTSKDGKIVSAKSFLGYGSTIYANAINMYITSRNMQNDGNYHYNTTDITRISLDRGTVKVEAKGTVSGSILNQFSMDEYKGVFRIVTTLYGYTQTENHTDDVNKDTEEIVPENNNSNCLYTLDSNLNIIGKIENIAPNERVYSVRFMGDVGYFVTFRQVDPLFAVDLSDPANPTVKSALKIPGFSSYLHSYTNGLLFGLGNDADEKTGRTECLKLSMFDVNDLTNLTLKDKLILEGRHYSEASYNHKAILVDDKKGIIAFPTDNVYLIYTYSVEKSFEKLAEINLNNLNNGYINYYHNVRGLYIGEYMYVFGTNILSSYNMSDYKLCDTEIFEKSDTYYGR